MAQSDDSSKQKEAPKTQPTSTDAAKKPKKKLSLEINDLSEVIERKISPA